MFENDITIYTDGGARKNPGPAAIGFTIFDHDRRIMIRHGEPIGVTTNNVAEYMGIIKALSWANHHLPTQTTPMTVRVYMDSLLVVNQMNGLYKVRNSNLKLLIAKVRQIENELSRKKIIKVFYTHLPEEENKTAADLVNEALDKNQVINTTS